MDESNKNRGTLLTIWLVLILISNFVTSIMYFFLRDSAINLLPNLSLGMIYFYGLISLLNFVMVIFLFKWKKWAFFVLCGSALVTFVLNLIAGASVFSAISGLLGILILYLIMQPRWNFFE